MKRKKITILLGLATIAIGSTATGIALTSQDFISKAETASDCVQVFDNKSKPILDDTGKGYAQVGAIRLFYSGASLIDNGHVKLVKGGYIYTDGTPYDAAKGWGSVINGLEEFSVDVIKGNMKPYTSYTEVSEKAFKENGYVSETYNSFTVKPKEYAVLPRYLALHAVKDVEINSITINASAKAYEEVNKLPVTGTVTGKLTTTNIEDNKVTEYKGYNTIKINETNISFYSINVANNDQPIERILYPFAKGMFEFENGVKESCILLTDEASLNIKFGNRYYLKINNDEINITSGIIKTNADWDEFWDYPVFAQTKFVGTIA